MSAELTVDAVVIGGGPAGLAAAIRLARAGADVAIVEENTALGGKLRGQLHEERSGEWWLGWDLAEGLAAEAAEAGVRVFTDAVAWAVEPGWVVRLSAQRDGVELPSQLRSATVLVATGAVEVPLPVPGWTLPGAMTIGAAQVLTNIHRVRPGRRSLVVGVDPLSVTIARAMALGGVDVPSIVLPPAGTPGSAPLDTLASLAPLTALAPAAYMRIGGAFLRFAWIRRVAAAVLPRKLGMWGIPLQLSTRLVRILGEDRVTGAELERVRPNGDAVPGSRYTIDVDSVCLSNGLKPLNDLVAPLGGEYAQSEELAGSVPLHSAEMAAQQPGLFVTGNAIGVEGAKIAQLQGAIAGAAMAESLGLLPEGSAAAGEAELREARRTSEFTFNPAIQAGHDRVTARWTEVVR